MVPTCGYRVTQVLFGMYSRVPENQSNPVVLQKTCPSSAKSLVEFCGSYDDEDPSETKSIRLSVIELPPPKTHWRSLIKALPHLPIRFFDDTSCFAVGETMSLRQDDQRILALTLGRRFGSTLIDHGDVPQGDILRHHPCESTSIADEWFSSLGLLRLYEKILTDHSSFTSRSIRSGRDLAELASRGDLNARLTFRSFARLLAEFLIPYVKKFRVQRLIIGGGLAQAWYLFEDQLKAILGKSYDIDVYFSLSHDRSICLGAAQQFLRESSSLQSNELIRKTTQNLLPVVKLIDTSRYDLYPSHRIPLGQIGVGHKALHERLVHLIEENRMVLIEGFAGTAFDEYAEELMKIYRQHPKKQALLIYDTRVFLRTETSTNGWIDQEKLTDLRKNLSRPCVVIGLGASFVDDTSPVVYIDLAKNELYYRTAAKRSSSDQCGVLDRQDYPILNKLKEDLLPRLSFFVDGQRPRCPTWLDGETFRQALAHLVNEPIRLRPWFESSPSGGQWLRSVCANLSQQAKNYAHSFELVASENGVLLSDDHRRLVEFSWNLLYRSQASRILGNDTHCRLFSAAKEFPIRFDIRETIDREHFRDITYYTLQKNIDGHRQVVLEISATHSIDTSDSRDRVSQPVICRVEPNQYEEQSLATSEHHLYEVQRLIIEPDESIEISRSTENRFQLCMLVEGDAIEIQFDARQRRQYNSLETFLIPASIGDYRLRPLVKSLPRPLVLLLVCLKWECQPLTSQLDE